MRLATALFGEGNVGYQARRSGNVDAKPTSPTRLADD
jgi:hypothetical protein